MTASVSQPAAQLWVEASSYGGAEAVLLAVMPRPTREAARRADAAWQ